MNLSTLVKKYLGTGSRIIASIIRLICLFVAFFCLKFAFSAFIEYDMNVSDLVPHQGILETIEPLAYWISDEDKPKEMSECKLKLQDDSNDYMTTERINFLTDNLNLGDTITVFTKKKIVGLDNIRQIDRNSISAKAPPNEIYHLMKNGEIIIDFQKHRDALIPHLITLPILAIISFLWFLGRMPFNWRFSH